MRYVTDLKDATLAKFDEVEADWRETAERQIENLESYWHCPTPQELDELSADDALGNLAPLDGVRLDVPGKLGILLGRILDLAHIARIEARAKAASK